MLIAWLVFIIIIWVFIRMDIEQNKIEKQEKEFENNGRNNIQES
jgi:uncharacterized membrane protein